MVFARRSGGAFAIVAVVAAMLVGVGSTRAPAVPSVRGFDGTTIKVATLGTKAELPEAETGAKARIRRFNESAEIKGVRIEYVDFADDGHDPATSLSEARRLVTQEGVFAIVGDVSSTNPGEYFNSQHVPYFGWAFDDTYCSREPTTSLYGFGFNGCQVPANAKLMPDAGRTLYEYFSQQGNTKPTVAVFSSDSQSGKNTVSTQASALQGAGFKVVYAKASIPPPPVNDYTPYAQKLLTSENGAPPDAMNCLLGTQCINLYALMQANNYQGVFLTSLYTDLLLKPLEGSVADLPFVNLSDSVPALEKLKRDVHDVKSDAPIDSGTMAGYLSTDMFIQALKTAAAKGTSAITPESVQRAAAHQTWKLEGVAGPTSYPASTAVPTPWCSTIVRDDGTAWVTEIPYSCSKTKYPVLAKFGS